ncbi:MAG: c-type cytochrome [Bacteroidales bacterium]
MKNLPLFFFLILIIVLTSFTVFVSQEPSKKTIPIQYDNLKNPIPYDAKNIAAGAKIYKKLCWTCHGDNGNGKGPGAAEIATKPADLNHPVVKSRTDGAMFWWISEGGNDMKPFKDVLTKQEIWQSVVYIRKIQNKIDK